MNLQDSNSNNKAKSLNRREFIIALGTGATLSITCYYAVNRLMPISAENANKIGRPEFPRLRRGIALDRKSGTVTDSTSYPAEPTHYTLNDTGMEVFERLDGRHTVESIAQVLAKKIGSEKSEQIEAKTALFIAQLAMLGLLEKPFFVEIFEEIVT